MKNPNGYGTVAKLSGNRRKPFVVGKPRDGMTGDFPIYDVIGYLKPGKQVCLPLPNTQKPI